MKNLFLYSLLISLLAIPLESFAQCDLPLAYEGNTGTNMTVLFSPDLISSLNITEENAYLVALTQSGLVVGSVSVYGISQIDIAIWGDDTSTPELDGALANELISFQLVNGTDLYDVIMPITVNYTTTGLVFEASAGVLTLICSADVVVEGCTDANAFNYNSEATLDDGSCIAVVEGCTEATAFNYSELANADDGSCIAVILGCTDITAFNYNELANTEDNSCEYEQTGGDCVLPNQFVGNTGSNMTVMLSETFINSLPISDVNSYIVALTQDGLVVGSQGLYGASQAHITIWGDDASTIELDGALADELISFKFIDEEYLYDVVVPSQVNYTTNDLIFQDTAATLAAVDCGFSPVLGCMDVTANNYNDLATEDNGSCTYTIYGCTDSDALNYNSAATEDDGSCEYEQIGGDCILPNQFVGNTGANMTIMLIPDFVSSLNVTEENAYIVALTTDGLVVGSADLFEVSQTFIPIWGDDTSTPETDGAQANEFISFQLVNGTDLYNVEMPITVNYASNGLVVQVDPAILTSVNCGYGCTEDWADNYNELATVDDGSCFILGCMDSTADNYNSTATEDDGSCTYTILGCTSDWADNYDEFATENDGSCFKLGCTEDWADNYEALATDDDGSCYKTGCTSDWGDNYDSLATIPSFQFPEEFNGNTGSNMTVMLTSGFVNSLNVTDPNAYMVTLNTDGLVVGSTNIFGVNQTTIAVWGDDIQTTNVVDGALASESLSFQLINGIYLYDIEMPTPVTYTSNGLSVQVNPAVLTLALGDDCIRLACTSEWADNYDALATEDDGSCFKLGCTSDWADNFDPFATINSSEIPEQFSGNTGANMTVMLTPDFISSLNITNENAYIVASASSGVVVGSSDLYGFSQKSMAIWGDDTSTPELDGAIAGEAISFQLVDGATLSNITMPTSVNYSGNGLSVQATAAILTLASGDGCTRLGCMSDWADNYDALATDDDESCSKLGCTSDWADNYDALATDDDESCYKVGCTSDWADNFDPFATTSSIETLPEPFVGNTGANMSVFLTPNFVSALTILDVDAYIVATVESGLVIGSQPIYGVTQTNLALWGDNATTTDVIDGALSNELVIFQLVDGDSLYDLSLASPVIFTVNGLSALTTAPIVTLISGDDCIKLGCTSDWADNYDALATEDDESCSKLGCTSDWADNYDEQATENDNSCIKEGCTEDWADNFDELATENNGSCFKLGCTSDWADNFDPFATLSSTSDFPAALSYNTGSNMTVMLIPSFINSLNVTDENAYLVALTQSGLVIGFTEVYGVSQTSIYFWGDDSTTPEIDGALANELISFQLVNGTDLYNVEMPSVVNYTTNGLAVQASPGVLTLAAGGDDCIRLGCTSEWADNYDELATDDDESCTKLGCTEDWADNYDVLATDDDGSCSKLGCTDVLDCNYDTFATIDDESCIGDPGCLDHFYVEYNPLAGCSLENACQTSWIQLYDSLQVEYNDLDISYNIGMQELINTNLTLDSLEVAYTYQTVVYIDSISQITEDYNELYFVCSEAGLQSAIEIESLNLMNESYIDSISQVTQSYNSLEAEAAEDMIQSGLTIDSLNYFNVSLSEEVEYWSSPIVIDLILGWNIIGYTPKEPQDIVATLQEIDDIILIVKNNAAEVYWPEYGFNGIGNLIPGQGYQIKVSEGYNGFTYPNVNGERIELTPTVPQWAIDMEVEMHPNDIRTLVKVVNMLGQEVNPITQFNGTVLLYLYNDATVEKKIVE